MKKYLIAGLLGLSFVAMPLASHAQTASSDTDIQALITKISQLLEIVQALQAQISALATQQQTPPPAAPAPDVPPPTSSATTTTTATTTPPVVTAIGNVVASCQADKATAAPGDSVNWTATVSGGAANMSYYWSLDGQNSTGGSIASTNGTNKIVAKYTATGNKYASLVLSSSDGSKTVQCSGAVTVAVPLNISPAYDPLAFSCSIDKTSLSVGGTATWSAAVIGGNKSYTYAWSLNDGTIVANNNANVIAVQYGSAGPKYASLTVTSGDGQSKTVQCSNSSVVTAAPATTYDPLVFSCSIDKTSLPIGGTATWTAAVIGGNKSYTYAWSLSDGTIVANNNANVIAVQYATSGAKYASLKVTSGDGQAQSVSCSNSVTVAAAPAPLAVSCSADNASISAGNSMNWNSTVSGGDGKYAYAWSLSGGTSIAAGSPAALPVRYDAAGSGYAAALKVTSGDGQTKSVTCVNTVTVTPPPPAPLAVSCSADQTSLKTGASGGATNWSAAVAGGTPGYTFAWSLSDGTIYANNGSNIIQVGYSIPGTKYAGVKVTSADGQSQSVACSNVVTVAAYAPITGSCSAMHIPGGAASSYIWTANVYGGYPRYSYQWAQSDASAPILGFTPNTPNATVFSSDITSTLSMSYPSVGMKQAAVIVTSGDGQTQTITCSPLTVPPYAR